MTGANEDRQEIAEEFYSKGVEETARNLKTLGVSTDIIIKATGLSEDSVMAL